MKITEITDEPGDVQNNASSVEWIDKYVQDIGKALRQQEKLTTVSERFAACKTDLERVELVLSLPEVHQVLTLPQSCQPCRKCTHIASQYRNEGNEKFKRKQFTEALNLYSKSEAWAPVADEQKTLALAYANRSAVLFHLGRHEVCLHDIRRAFLHQYPQEMAYKLHDREARCLRAVGRHREAGPVYQRLLDSLQHAALDEEKRTRCKTDVENSMLAWTAACLKSKSVNTITEECEAKIEPPPPLSANPNSQFPSLSRRCDVAFSEASGRYIVAADDVGAGEVVMVEKPFASVLLPEQYGVHCHVCFLRTDVMVTCPRCTQARYCSDRCLELAEATMHKYECAALNAVHASGLGKFGHLALRAITVKGPNFFKQFQESEERPPLSEDPRLKGSNGGKYSACNYRAIYHLVGHSDLRTPGDLFRRTLGAVYLLRCLQLSDFFRDRNDTFSTYVCALILRHLQSFPCNAHEISELQLDKDFVAESLTMEIGAGIYASLSLFNHSCDPVATRHFYGDACVVRTIRPALRGQQISDNYGTVFAVEDRNARQEKLKMQYHFDCQCTACMENWPLYLNIPHESPAFKCTSCQRELESVKLENCPSCSSPVTLEAKKHEYNLATEKYHTGLKKLLKGDAQEAKAYFVKALNMYHGNIKLPWRDVNNCQEGLKQCFSILANCHELSPQPRS